MNRPKYQLITDWIRKRIENGELSAGDRLESEHEISSSFGISRQTVRHALALLVQEGVLDKVQGSGTYVRKKRSAVSGSVSLSHTVTIISTYIDGYIFPRILKEMVKTLEASGYGVRIMYTENRLETEKTLLQRILGEDSNDPLIVEPVMSGLPNPNLVYYKMLRERGIPILFFHSEYPELDIPCVRMDDIKAGKKAAEYLIGQGHTRIAGIFKADDGQGRRRYEGMIQALRSAGIELSGERICWMDSQDLRQPDGMELRIDYRLKGCTACVCYNDEVAHMLTDYCAKKRIRVPEELSIVSIDNSELARLNTVPLTSVMHPMEMLGKKAAENMLHLIQDPYFQAKYYFEPEIEIRASVQNITENG